MSNNGQFPWVESFNNVINSPDYWISTATDLLEAATVLHEQWDHSIPTNLRTLKIFKPTLMLRAFALEVLFKAFWLKKDINNALGVNGFLKGPKKIRQHDLNKIADAAGILLNEIEKRVLLKLKIFGEMGRCPMPRKSSDRLIDFSDEKGLGTSWGSNEESIFENLIKRLLKDK